MFRSPRYQPIGQLESKASETSSNDVTLLRVAHTACLSLQVERAALRRGFVSHLDDNLSDVFTLRHEAERRLDVVPFEHGRLQWLHGTCKENEKLIMKWLQGACAEER